MGAPPRTIEERIRREAYLYGYAKAPRECSRAAYFVAAIPPDMVGTEDDADMRALLDGPHGEWARRELAERFKEGRRLGDPPPDMPGYRPRRTPRAA